MFSSLISTLILLITPSLGQDETVLQCSVNPGCQIRQCDPSPLGWEKPGFSISKHLEKKEFPITCVDKNARLSQNTGNLLTLITGNAQDIRNIASNLRNIKNKVDTNIKDMTSTGDITSEPSKEIQELRKESRKKRTEISDLRKTNKNQDLEIKKQAREIEELRKKTIELAEENKEIKKENAKQFSQINSRIFPSSCRGVHKLISLSWNETGGSFEIYPTPVSDKIEVYCDLTTDVGGWIVFQRRMDGSEDFFRGWDDYVNGFGNVVGEFWLGLENIYQILKGKNYELRIDMEDWEGNKAHAKYGKFTIGDSSKNYPLTVGKYSGNAGDSLGHSQHQGRTFSTKDADHDAGTNNCAAEFRGGFWYGACHATNLNGLYIKGGTASYGISIVWHLWKGQEYSIKFVEMKMRETL